MSVMAVEDVSRKLITVELLRDAASIFSKRFFQTVKNRIGSQIFEIRDSVRPVPYLDAKRPFRACIIIVLCMFQGIFQIKTLYCQFLI
jgi:hypothetical protein